MPVALRHASRLSLAGLAVLGLGIGVPLITASAAPSPAKTCVDAGNVWVHVEISTDVVKGGCATEFSTGFEALTSAGFTTEVSDAGFLNTIDGEPSDPGPEAWWSYASANMGESAWQFYQVGGASSAPKAGSIEGWRLLDDFETTDSLPSQSPAQLLADVESAESPSPSASATPTAPTSAIPSAQPSATARPTPSLPRTGV